MEVPLPIGAIGGNLITNSFVPNSFIQQLNASSANLSELRTVRPTPFSAPLSDGNPHEEQNPLYARAYVYGVFRLRGQFTQAADFCKDIRLLLLPSPKVHRRWPQIFEQGLFPRGGK